MFEFNLFSRVVLLCLNGTALEANVAMFYNLKGVLTNDGN